MTRLVAPVLVGQKPDEGPRKRITDEELNRLLNQHEVWLTGPMDMNDRPDLSGLELRNADLSKRKLHKAYFRGSNLENAKFNSSDLSEADFSGAILRGACFPGADLRAVFAVNADMSHCDFYKDKSQKLVNGVRVMGPVGPAKMIKARLAAANLSHASFACADLSGSDIQRCVCVGTHFVSANLSNCIGQNADFENADFLLANLEDADLRNSVLTNVNLHQTNLIKADLRNTTGRFFLSDNSIRETKFSPSSNDAYSLLRRSYTGPMFFLIFFLL